MPILHLSPKAREFLNSKQPNLLFLLEVEEMGQQNLQELNSDDEPSAATPQPDQAGANGGNGELSPQQQQMQADAEAQQAAAQPLTVDDVLHQSIELADQKFVQFRLYDKITNLQSMVENLKNISMLNIDEIDQLTDFEDYINILNELIFTLDVNAMYQIIGQIEIDLHTFLETVNDRMLTKNREKELKKEKE